jgi:phosphoribosylformylglycinamidine cyclo-ligase
MSEAYREAGVNLELGDELSKMLYEASKQTWQNRVGKFGEPTADIDSFSGLRSLSLEPLLSVPKPEGIRLNMGDDGVGTKVEVAQRIGKHDTIAHDLLAMICDDAAVKGFEPAAVTTTLDVRKLDESMRPAMSQLALGYIAAANAAQVSLVNGEVAELGNLVGGYGDEDNFQYNWSATFIAAGHKDRLLDGTKVQEGDLLVGLREMGFRSNGLSLVRKTLAARYGELWHELQYTDLGQTLGELVLTPSIIYTPILTKAIGGYDLRQNPLALVHGAAHVTGGGVPGKLGRMLQPSGLGAAIHNPFEPVDFVQEVQQLAGIGDEEAYKVWNMGQGMVIATPDAKQIINIANEHFIPAKVIGEVVKSPTITIRSAASETGKKLTYEI